jgi:hypothetical protein
MIASMQRWPVAIVYIIANIAIAVHLYHGIWSMFQSLGLNNPRYNAARRGSPWHLAPHRSSATCCSRSSSSPSGEVASGE